MPMPSYLKLTGKSQGAIEGSCVIKGKEKTIEVWAMSHNVEIPRNIHDGLPSGNRRHLPLEIVKNIDKSSPKLYQALTSGERLTEVNLDFWRITPEGKEELYYTIKLSEAIIVNMQTYYPETFVEANAQYRHMEKVSFTYEKIVWTWKPDGIEAEDDWKAPK